MPYASDPVRSAPHNGRDAAGYRAACAEVRERVRLGARCYFWRRPGHDRCPGVINLRLRANARWSFTAHHIHRLMDGGAAVVDARHLVPAHRACNARDGLMAQNARRAARAARSATASRIGSSLAVGVRRVMGAPGDSGVMGTYGSDMSGLVRGGGVGTHSDSATDSDVPRDRVTRTW